MLTDNEVKEKFDKLVNKLKANLYNDVINEASLLLKKRQHQVFFNILSIAYQNIGEFKKSENVMKEALRMNANNPFFLNNMGITQHKLENFSSAEEHFKRGLKIAPNYINILNNLANLKKDLNFTDTAIEYYKKSISINSKVIETHLNIASCYQSIGKYDQSISHLENVLKIDPKFTVADRLISSMKTYEEKDNHLNDMNTKLMNLDLTNERKADLYFAIGKAYEDLKKYDQSFSNYHNGNKLLKKLYFFDLEQEKKKFTKIKKFFQKQNKIDSYHSQRKLIFIVGMPRSGTSLVEQILSSHDNVYGGGELNFLSNIIKNKILNKDDNISIEKIADINELSMECAKEYYEKIKDLDDTEKDFTDKTPLNFRFIGFIKNFFPNSKIINCSRDPIDIIWSNYKNYFPASLPFTNDLNDLSNYHKIYLDLMQFWKKDFDKDIYDINYENLVKNSKEEIKKLLKFCDLEWNEKCLKHENNSRSIKTASATQARKPIYKSAIKSSDIYRKYLSEILEN